MTKKTVRDSSYHLIHLISRLPMSFSRLFARGAAKLIHHFQLSKIYHVIDLNLRISLPHLTESEHQAILKKTISNELTSYFEFTNIWGNTPEKNLQRIGQVIGQEHLMSGLDRKKGIILIVPHFGTWEIMNSWVAQYTQMTVMYKPVKNPHANQFVKRARSREHATLVPTDESGVRQVFKALKKGGTTVILPDHTPDAGGELIPYFGIPLETSLLSAKLLQKTQATALMMYAVRNDSGTFDLRIQPFSDDILNQTPQQATANIVTALETLIQAHPEHYHWSYKRFSAHPTLRHLYNIPQADALKRIEELRKTTQAYNQNNLAHEPHSL